MCWEAVYPEGVPVNQEDLVKACQFNEDGFGGMVFNRDGKLITFTNMDPMLAIAHFTDLREAHIDQPAAFHARLATTGTICAAECHPQLTPDGRMAIMLNGTLDIELEPGNSDTWTLAKEILPILDLDDQEDYNWLELLVQKTKCKLVIFRQPRNRLPEQRVLIFNAANWLPTPYGALVSNRSHLGQGVGWDESRDDGTGVLTRWRLNANGTKEVEWSETERLNRIRQIRF